MGSSSSDALEAHSLRAKQAPPSGGSALFFRNRIGIRTNDKTYPFSDAEFQKETREYTVRQDTEKLGVRKSDVVTREAEERMRIILKLQGTDAPDDIVIFSHRGPMTIIEKKVALGKAADDAS